MFVLHAVLTGDAARPMALWAETSTVPEALSRPGRGRRAAHRFAVDSITLRSFAGSVGAGHELTLTLPSRPSGPVPSPELIVDQLTSPTGPPEPRAWRVPAVALSPAELAAWRSADGAVAGSTIRHLHQLSGFVRDLVQRGRVLPAVVDGQARWQPVLIGQDAARARALVQAAPPALFAAGWGPTAAGARGSSAAPDSAAPNSAAADSAAPDVPGRRAGALADLIDLMTNASVRARVNPVDLRGPRVDPRISALLAALTSSDPRVRLSAGEQDSLAAALRQWQRDAIGGAVRACFRLFEPELDTLSPGSETAWKVRLSLQAADEPSLQIDANTIWRARGRLAGIVGELDSPQETFLAELGRAARLYPDLSTALRTARPAELLLDTEGAHRFLSSGASLLSAAGFGVLLPSWWSAPATRLGLRMKVSTPAQPGLVSGARSVAGAAALTEYRFDLALGDDPLTAQELAELADLQAPLVRIRGQWLELDAERLAAGLAMVGRTGTATVGDILRIGTGMLDAASTLPIVAIEADGWLSTALTDASQARLEEVPVPASFTGTLRPYQHRGLNWLDFLQRAGLGGILADDMGLGKTVQLLAWFALQRTEDGPTLLICPMSLVGNWQREATRFAPALRIHVHHGADRPRGKKFHDAVELADVVLTTYSLAARDAVALAEIGWARLVLDEAQAIKNAATRQSVAIRSLPGTSRIAVTGTPVENRLADLWSIMDFVNPGLLGSARQFKERYAVPVERHGDEEAAERLRRYTSPFLLRRLKTDRSIIADLPDKMEMEVVCNLTTEQASLYQAVVDDMMTRIEATEGIERRGLVLATMTKLKQVCNHPAQFLRDSSRLVERSGKLARLEEITEEILAVGDKALLFTQYAEFGSMLRGHLTGRFGREVLFLHGGVAKADRDRMVERFQTGGPGSPPLFVLSLKAGGTGLTLTAANHVVHVDRWWNPAVEDQATDRAFRIGQRKSVQVRKFVCAGTLEEKISAMFRASGGSPPRSSDLVKAG